MEHKKVVEKHIDLQTVVDYTTCDVCHKKIEQKEYWRYVNCDISKSVTSDGDFESEEFDICEECWDKELVPWFQQFGSFPRTR